MGNADTLVSEGSKLFNRKDYAEGLGELPQGHPRQPGRRSTPTCSSRAPRLLAKELSRACYAYRVYLKVAPETPERKKASAESDQCERQLKTREAPAAGPDAEAYVELRATFFAALDKGELLGARRRARRCGTLVQDGFLGPELGEMAPKLGAAVVAAGRRHLQAGHGAGARAPGGPARRAARCYEVAPEVGASPPDTQGPHGLPRRPAPSSPSAGFEKAEPRFAEAAKADPVEQGVRLLPGAGALPGRRAVRGL